MTEEQLELLRISYSNNQKLIEIDNKLMFNNEKRDDFNHYLRDRNSKYVWTTTVFNLVLAASVGVVALKYGLNLDKNVAEHLLIGLAIFIVIFGSIEYIDESKRNNNFKKNIEEKYGKNNIEKKDLLEIEYNIKELKQLKKNIIKEEKEIKKEFEGKTKIK